MSMTNVRQQVYEAIDSERKYQYEKWGMTGEHCSFGDWLVYMDSYIQIAKHDLTHDFSHKRLTDTIRKITALGVACLEDKGVSNR